MADQPNKDSEKPKIIIDDDWKAQAEAEKEKLAEEIEHKEEPAAPAAQADQAAADQGQPPQQLPPADLTSLINQIAMQAMMALGGYEDPKTKKRMVDLTLAKFHIDTLTVIEEKTAGNRSDAETELLDKVIYEMRMHFVQFAQQASGPVV